MARLRGGGGASSFTAAKRDVVEWTRVRSVCLAASATLPSVSAREAQYVLESNGRNVGNKAQGGQYKVARIKDGVAWHRPR